MSKITDLSLDDLRTLINNQLAGRRKAEREVAEMDALLLESIGEFYRRVNNMPKPAEGSTGDGE